MIFPRGKHKIRGILHLKACPNLEILLLSFCLSFLSHKFFHFAYSKTNSKPLRIAMLLLSHFSHVRLYVTPYTAAHQDPLSLGFSRQEYWRWVAISFSKNSHRLLCGSDGKASTYNANLGSIPGSGRSSGEGNGKTLQYSCLENPTDGRAS